MNYLGGKVTIDYQSLYRLTIIAMALSQWVIREKTKIFNKIYGKGKHCTIFGWRVYSKPFQKLGVAFAGSSEN